MIILGIDPGSNLIGWGLVETDKGKMKHLGHGAVAIKEKDTAKRLVILEKKIGNLLKKTEPDLVALEKLFFYKNAKTAIRVAEARGVILLSVAKSKTPFVEITPLQLKNQLTGYGLAGKANIQKMVKLILNLKEEPKPDDAADGLALAITATL